MIRQINTRIELNTNAKRLFEDGYLHFYLVKGGISLNNLFKIIAAHSSWPAEHNDHTECFHLIASL